jgi:hypothetical protein
MKNWKNFIDWASKKGIPVVFVRDPITQLPSVSLSLVVISTGFVMFGLFNKVANLMSGVDMESALAFFYASCSLYFGRSVAKGVSPNNKEE